MFPPGAGFEINQMGMYIDWGYWEYARKAVAEGTRAEQVAKGMGGWRGEERGGVGQQSRSDCFLPSLGQTKP